MRPQKQLYTRNDPDTGTFGDCHRTCIAMILNMDRDEVPHFMEGVPPGLPADHELSLAAIEHEVTWLRQHGLAPFNIAFDGSMPLDDLIAMLASLSHGAPFILGCTSSSGCNHSVVMLDGEVHNPNFGTIVGPMLDGFWWITIYSVGPNWMSRTATRLLAFEDGWSAACAVAAEGQNPAAPGLLRDAAANYLQPPPAAPTVVEQEAQSDVS